MVTTESRCCDNEGAASWGHPRRAHPIGTQKLSLSDVAAAAGVSRADPVPLVPLEAALLDSFGVYEQEKYDAGIAEASRGSTARHVWMRSCASSWSSSTPPRSAASSTSSPSTSSTR